jgi:hypothetical protein
MRSISRAVLTLVVVVAAAVAGTLTATALGLGAGPDEVAAPDPRIVPGSDSIESRAADPAGGPPWAGRVYLSQGGQICADFGREIDGRIGLVDAAGSFHERRPDDAGGNCGDPNAALGLMLAVDYYPDDPTTSGVEAARTVVHGVAGTRVRTISVRWPTGDEALEVSRRGAFISVYGRGASVVPVLVEYQGGRQETFELDVPTG